MLRATVLTFVLATVAASPSPPSHRASAPTACCATPQAAPSTSSIATIPGARATATKAAPKSGRPSWRGSAPRSRASSPCTPNRRADAVGLERQTALLFRRRPRARRCRRRRARRRLACGARDGAGGRAFRQGRTGGAAMASLLKSLGLPASRRRRHRPQPADGLQPGRAAEEEPIDVTKMPSDPKARADFLADAIVEGQGRGQARQARRRAARHDRQDPAGDGRRGGEEEVNEAIDSLVETGSKKLLTALLTAIVGKAPTHDAAGRQASHRPAAQGEGHRRADLKSPSCRCPGTSRRSRPRTTSSSAACRARRGPAPTSTSSCARRTGSSPTARWAPAGSSS